MQDAVIELARCGRALDAKHRQREIIRRVAAYERGEAVLYDVDDVMAEAKRIAL